MRAWLALALLPAVAHANTPEDVYGASARTIGMGGAGTAVPGDYAAVHYNPAALDGCESDQLTFDISRIAHSLSFTDDDATRPDPLTPKRTRDQTRFMLGTCLHLPLDLTLGAMLGFGTPGAIELDQQTANETPSFVMYGENHHQIAIGLGLSWRATRSLSIGGGFAALFKSRLPLGADLPILEPDPRDPSGYRPVNFSLGIGLGAMLAPRVGMLYAPSKRVRAGIAYRGALYHDLDVDAYITAKLIVEIPVPVHVDSLGWFSPKQLSAGASGEPLSNLTVAADVTYYRWGELRTRGSSYPFLNMYSLDPEGASGALVFPRPIRSGWKNNLAWRAGGELRLPALSLAIRAGLGYRTRAVNDPGDSNVNLLDGPVVTASTGVAWRTGKADKRAPRSRWWRYTLPNVSFSASAFMRVDHMLAQTVADKSFRFGGQVFQLGANAALGW